MGQGHDVVLAELGDAVRQGRAGASGRFIRHDLPAACTGATGHPRSGRGDPAGIHDRIQILTSLELIATKAMPKFA
jgi:hypothetical protein